MSNQTNNWITYTTLDFNTVLNDSTRQKDSQSPNPTPSLKTMIRVQEDQQHEGWEQQYPAFYWLTEQIILLMVASGAPLLSSVAYLPRHGAPPSFKSQIPSLLTSHWTCPDLLVKSNWLVIIQNTHAAHTHVLITQNTTH